MPAQKRHTPTTEQQVLCDLLISIRKEAGLDQVEVGKALGKGQSYVSRYETGERRLDILELRRVCETCEVSLNQFIKRLESSRPFRGPR